MEKQVRVLFGKVPEEPEEYILASQISQAEAKKYFIERMRVDRPHKTGIIWWNLLDGWPQMSDAVVDYYYTKKLAYHYIKISQAPFTVAAAEPENGKLQIFACNDTLSRACGTLTVRDALGGEILCSCAFEAKENISTNIVTLQIDESKQKILVFEWEIDGKNGFNHYFCGTPPIDLEMYKEFLRKYSKELFS
jgi:beta-mannosidase